MNVFKEYWDRELYSLSVGTAVTVGQLITTIIVAIVGALIAGFILLDGPERLGIELPAGMPGSISRHPLRRSTASRGWSSGCWVKRRAIWRASSGASKPSSESVS